MDELDMGETLRGFSPGQVVGERFKLQKMIGRGGMGIVWLADDLQLDRSVALKFLPEAVAMDPRNVNEMKRETRRALELTHPHIVRIYDFVQSGETIAISMEYVTGDTLARRAADLPHHAFEFGEDIQRWTQQLGEALHYAHRRAKIIHRDLKPANLMTDENGDLRVTDFGISASITESVSRVSVRSLTSGTPLYMSPQQMMGENPSVADDIYSLGATLYELLTGKPPFYSGNIILQAQQKVPPSLAQRRLDLGWTDALPIPPAWEETIAACLAKEVADRPASVAEVLSRLELGMGVGGGRTRAPFATASTPPISSETNTAAAPEPVAPAEPESEAAAAPVSHTGRNMLVASLVVLLAAGGVGYFGFKDPLLDWWAQRSETPSTATVAAAPASESAVAPAEDAAGVEATTSRRAMIKAVEMTATAAASDEVVFDLGSGVSLPVEHIDAGFYRRGSPDTELGRRTDERLVDTDVAQEFWLGRTEVTQAQYEAIMGTNPSRNRFQGADHPVEQVTFRDLTGPDGFLVRVNRWLRDHGHSEWNARLPTEDEWEYAARAGTRSALNNGRDLSNGVKDPAADVVAVYGTVATTVVGSKQPNAWGLYDMHGNVAEWTADGVLRGGSFKDGAEFIRSASRLRGYQSHRQPDERFGFRLLFEKR